MQESDTLRLAVLNSHKEGHAKNGVVFSVLEQDDNADTQTARNCQPVRAIARRRAIGREQRTRRRHDRRDRPALAVGLPDRATPLDRGDAL